VAQEVSTIDILAAAEAVARAQRRAAPLLENLVLSGRLPSSLMFVGPEGAGKELMAVRLAAMLNCERALGAGPAGVAAIGGEHEEKGGAANAKANARVSPCAIEHRCPSCSKVRTLEHPDFHVIYPIPRGELEKDLPAILESRRDDFFASGEFRGSARSVGIDLVRLVIEMLSKHPFEGRRSVVAIFEAHLATVEAQNALLKLLEEPPQSATIILVTEFPDRFLPTILSRCQEIRFDPLPADAVAGFLTEFCSVEREEARRLAALAQGNIRRGMKLLDERFQTLWKDAAAVVGLMIDGKAKELLGEAGELAARYTREEAGDLLEETAIVVGLIMRNRDGRLGDAEREVLEATLGTGRLAAAAKRDLAADVRKIFNSIDSLRRNADVELTLSQLLLDLTGKWY
jgi:DNA polymerase III delta prime subunit